MNLKDKIILVTGASSGIGEATAKLLASKGAIIVMQARGEDNLKKVASEIKYDGGRVHIYPVDLTDSRQVSEVAERVISEVGLPDIIINNAGAGHWQSIFESKSEDFDQQMSAPFFAAAYTTTAYINKMKERDSGHIITMNSIACYFNIPGAIGYASARHALRGFSNALHADLYHTNLNASMLVSGKVDSSYFTNNPGAEERVPKVSTSMASTLTVDDVALSIYKLTESKRKVVVIPFMMSIYVWLNQLTPGLFDMLSRWTGYKAG